MDRAFGGGRVAAALCAALAGCTHDDVTGPEPRDGPVAVTLTVVPQAIVPGQASTIAIHATLPDTQTLTTFQLALQGLGGDTVLNLPIAGRGPQAVSLGVQVPNGPIKGVIQLRARARVRTAIDSADGILTVLDDGPPRLTLSAPTVIDPPQFVDLTVVGQDAAGITEMTIHVEGVVQRDTTIVTAYAPRLEWGFSTSLPATAPLGDSIVVRVTARDGFGKTSSASHVARLADTRGPDLAIRVDPVHHAGIDESFYPLVFFPGDTMRFHISASDNHALEWFGYRLLQAGDSLLGTAPAESVAFEFIVPPGTNTPEFYIQAFARDSAGHEDVRWGYASVMDGTFRPVTGIGLDYGPMYEYDGQGAYVLDAKRDLLYYTAFTASVQVLSLSPLLERPPVWFNAFVRGVDMMPGGDTLVALLVGRPNRLVLWDAGVGPSSTDTIPVTLLGDCDAWNLRVAANGHALVTGWATGTCPTVDVDLRTGAQRFRSIPSRLRNLAAAPDHRTIVAWDEESAVVYRSDTDSIGPVRSLFPGSSPNIAHGAPSFDATGSAILIRNRLYDPDLASYRWIQPDPDGQPLAHALSGDGRTAFLGLWPGYSPVDVASASATERIILPRFPWQIIAHPDGQRLLVFGWRWVGIVDLR